MFKIITTLLLSLFSLASLATNVPEMVRQAILTGQAGGLVTGSIAHEAKQNLRADGSLTLNIQRVFEYAQDECARLRLDFNQVGAMPPGSNIRSDYAWSSELSICMDGHPPVNTQRKTP